MKERWLRMAQEFVPLRVLSLLCCTVLLLWTGCSVHDPGGEGGRGDTNEFNRESAADQDRSEAESPDARWNVPEGELAYAFIAPPSNATACSSGAQCPTGNCVDGFCCDSKCDNKCMACSAAKKGSGVDGICGSIAYDTDPDNDCPFGACDGKNQCKNYNGFSCISGAQCLSNYCVDGMCCNNICMGSCQACSAAKKGSGQDGACGSIKAATDPDNECTNSDCNGSGACTTSPQPTSPNGAACTSAAQCASGFCADGVCCDSWCLGSCQACTAAKKNQGVDGTCGPVANNKDPDDECWGGACNGAGVCKQYNGVPCSDKSQCLSNYCVDGFCCGNICTGWCSACSEARKGGGYDGVCGAILSGRDPDNECTPGECNGSGTCNQAQTPLANGSACIASPQCASGNCVDGFCCDTTCTESCKACSAAKKGSGANGTCGFIATETDPDGECGYGGRCGGNGVCKSYNGLPCTSTGQCFSNYCADGVCCGNICNQTCNACSAAKKGQGSDGACGPIANGKDPDNECNPGECNGSSACNQSQTPQANGASCAIAGQCLSGNCVDGVCCDTSCTGSCQACSATKKGQGTSGTCGPIKYDTDPDEECYGGACSGSGACQSYNGATCATGTQCLSTYCVDGVCCGNHCGGLCYACTAAKKGSGYNGVCGLIANTTDPDNECNPGECNGSGACSQSQLLANGASCTMASQCSSGLCVDGVCCNATCTETCKACNVAGSLGTCSFVPAGQGDANATTPCTTTCNGSGVCNASGSTCDSGIQCPSLICKEGTCDSPKPSIGPTKWITTKLFNVDVWPSQIEALNTRGSGVAVLGVGNNDYPSTHDWSDTLDGSFDGNGFPSVNVAYDSCGWNAPTPTRSQEFLGRSGVTGYYCKNGQQTCFGDWPYSSGQAGPKQLIGANDAGQAGGILFAPWCNINIPLGPSGLVRYSSAGTLELNQPQITWTDRIVLGPLGEFHVGTATNLSKYDVNAILVWTKTPTISGTVDYSAWDVDAAGNILIALSFSGSIDYGMGPMTATGPADLGLVKLDPNGNPLWQKHFGDSSFTSTTVTLSRTGSSDLAVSGNYTGAMNFGTGALQGGSFVAKFNSSGNAMWHVNIYGGTMLVSGDASGAVYVGSNSIDFGWGMIYNPHITPIGVVGPRSLTMAKFQE